MTGATPSLTQSADFIGSFSGFELHCDIVRRAKVSNRVMVYLYVLEPKEEKVAFVQVSAVRRSIVTELPEQDV